MTILDQPISEETTPVKRNWTWFEKIFPPLLILIAIARELFSLLIAYEAILFLGCFISISYLVGYYWMAKPYPRNVRTVVVSILYGWAFAIGTMGFFMADLFFLKGKIAAVVVATTFFIIIIIDVITARRKSFVADAKTVVRCGILGIAIILLWVIPERDHVTFTYRKFPDFVEYYRGQQGNRKFSDIWNDYYSTHPHPSDLE